MIGKIHRMTPLLPVLLIPASLMASAIAIDSAYAAETTNNASNATTTEAQNITQDYSMQIFPLDSILTDKANTFNRIYGHTTDLKAFLESKENFVKVAKNAAGTTFAVSNPALGTVDANGIYQPTDASASGIKTNVITYTKQNGDNTITGKITVKSRAPYFVLMNANKQVDIRGLLSSKHKEDTTLTFSTTASGEKKLDKALLAKFPCPNSLRPGAFGGVATPAE